MDEVKQMRRMDGLNEMNGTSSLNAIGISQMSQQSIERFIEQKNDDKVSCTMQQIKDDPVLPPDKGSTPPLQSKQP